MLLLLVLLVAVLPAPAQPTPHAPDAQIQSWVNQINADSILATITRLDGFHSRHTYSDTSSDTRGIGAAMRWVEAKAREYDTANRLQFEWFPWTQFWNGQQVTRHILIARANGHASPRGRYVIGGHLDSRTVSGSDTGRAPGADDNGSSCAALLELVRVLPDSIDHDLEIIWFTGEEQGLWGSAAYADYLASRGTTISGMIAMDMISHIALPSGAIDSVSCRLYAQGLASQGGSSSNSRVWQRSFRWLAESYEPNFAMVIFAATDRPGRGSDHISFSEAGYPALRVIERNEDLTYQHSANDLAQFVTPSYARKIATVTMGGLVNCLLAPLPPPTPLVDLPVDLLGVFIDDTVSLPDGGEFFLAVRDFYHADWDTVINLGTERAYPFDWGVPGNLYGFALARSNAAGRVSPFSEEVVMEDAQSAWERPLALPTTTLTVSPNPFNHELRIETEFFQSGNVRLSIYDLLGREVETLYSGTRDAGPFTAFWDAHDAATGIYLVRLISDGEAMTKKVMLLK